MSTVLPGGLHLPFISCGAVTLAPFVAALSRGPFSGLYYSESYQQLTSEIGVLVLYSQASCPASRQLSLLLWPLPDPYHLGWKHCLISAARVSPALWAS